MSDNDQITLLRADTLPPAARQPATRMCLKCGRIQALIGYYEHGGARYWVYIPAECKCWEGKTIRAEISS